jgi:hypothetical protein
MSDADKGKVSTMRLSLFSDHHIPIIENYLNQLLKKRDSPSQQWIQKTLSEVEE